ncbi:hypothetical protein [Enterobacter sp. 22466]|uniref:hypothetical protein n=1 Tax=Enterobacter sp. 22466 TaxID=3453924 RepID=UPI003F83AF19
MSFLQCHEERNTAFDNNQHYEVILCLYKVKKKEDWIPKDESVSYIVTSKGNYISSGTPSEKYRLQRGDILTISPDGKVSIDSQSLGILNGGSVNDIPGVTQISFSGAALNSESWTIYLYSPSVKNSNISGASNVESRGAGGFKGDKVQSGAVISRLY